MQMLASDKPISSPSEDLFSMSLFAAASAKSLLEMGSKDGFAIALIIGGLSRHDIREGVQT
jgi:hypothetical protein